MPGTDPKKIQLPDRDDMLRRLKSVSEEKHAVEKLYPLMLKSAGRKLLGQGVVLMVYQAITEYAEGNAMLAKIWELQAKHLVTALVDDEEVRSDALRLVDDVEGRIASEQDSQPPAPPRPPLSDTDKASLMRQIKRLASIYDEHTTEHEASESYRVGGANPFYNQTANGLYLEFYYGSPSEVWTPWGKWHFAAAQSRYVDLEGFMARLTVREEVPEMHKARGTYGPVYALLAIDGEKLPEPQLLTDRQQYFEYEAVLEEWPRLFEAN